MIAKHIDDYPVRWMCGRLGVSTSGFYARQIRGDSKRCSENQRLGLRIRALHKKSDGTYGSPRIHRDLIEEDIKVGRHRVARLMRKQDLQGRSKRRFKNTTDSSHSLPIAENLVARTFQTSAPTRLWVADITYIRTWEGWLYLAMVSGVFSRRIVGYAVADHMRAEIVVEAFENAVAERRPAAGLIHHSDRGSQYASKDFQTALKKIGGVCSMSRKGDCYDNSMAESFFSPLKLELIYRGAWPTNDGAKKAIREYIDNFYNARRRHSAIGNVSPLEYEVGRIPVRPAT